MKQENILCVQFSNKLLESNYPKILIDYNNKIYQTYNNEGLYKGRDFYELPLWISRISALYDGRLLGKKKFIIIKDLLNDAEKINNSNTKYLLFSVLDSTVNLTKDLLSKLNTKKVKIITGGYSVINNKSIKHCKSILELATYLQLPYNEDYDYKCFKGNKTIPRLSLSYGCNNNCKFCIINENVKIKHFPTIIKQLDDIIKYLKFKIIYIDDKTFGQATNYKYLDILYERVAKKIDFNGFIIQTTPSEFNKFTLEHNPYFVELGIESYNDSILKKYNKPFTTNVIDTAINKAMKLDIKIVPNIIVGLPEETEFTYRQTINFLKLIKPIIKHININLYSDYSNDNLLNRDETILCKPMYSPKQNELNKWFLKEIINIGTNILNDYGKTKSNREKRISTSLQETIK
jgi:radical SAM superfamily enzyme YgiQ (UPF0313 family)